MFSGKTEELIRRLRCASAARKRVQVFKPAIDNRYAEAELVTHSNNRMRCEAVASVSAVLENLRPQTQVVGIDEANFFGESLVSMADQLANEGKQVIIAGLDTDYLGRPFLPVPDLLAIAESITKTLAICVCCGQPAKHSQRLVNSDKLILVGASDAYEARCRRCFKPGLTQQRRVAGSPS